MTWVTLHGRHAPVSSSRSSRLYFVLSGEIAVGIEGGEKFTLTAEQGAVIAKGQTYVLEGAGTYLVVNTPAFEPGDDVYSATPLD